MTVPENLAAFAAESYGFDKGTLGFISASTNAVFYFKKDEKSYILRLSQHPAEQAVQTRAELDWLYYLAGNGINVSLPLRAKNGEFVLLTEADGRPVILSAYEMLPGQFWDKNDPARWNEKVFYDWGRLTGDMHRLTKGYFPPGGENRRGEFTGREALSLDKLKSCPAVYKAAEEIIDEMTALPKDTDSYGLIHYDLHPWNFLIDGGQINVFDFDDCLYGWFALDIGVALYHGLWWGRRNDAGCDFTDDIVENYLRGYLSANRLSDYWLTKIPLFMRFRQICKFSWFYDPDNVDGHQTERIRNIENGVLFTDCELNSSLFKN